MKNKVLIALLLLFFFKSTQAQVTISSEVDISDSTQTHVLVSKRGDIFVGKLIKIEGTSVVFLLNDTNKLQFRFNELEKIAVYDPENSENYYSGTSLIPKFHPEQGDWGYQQLIYSSTAFPYPKREWEYRNADILWNTVEGGITNNISIGGGWVIPFAPMLRAKAAFKIKEKFHLGLGANLFIPIEASDIYAFSHAYLVGTIGSPKNFLNLTVGKFFDFDVPGDSELVITFGGSVKVAKNWSIRPEVLLIPEFDDAFGAGLEVLWMIRQNRLEFGVISAIDSWGIYPFPLVGYARRF